MSSAIAMPTTSVGAYTVGATPYTTSGYSLPASTSMGAPVTLASPLTLGTTTMAAPITMTNGSTYTAPMTTVAAPMTTLTAAPMTSGYAAPSIATYPSNAVTCPSNAVTYSYTSTAPVVVNNLPAAVVAPAAPEVAQKVDAMRVSIIPIKPESKDAILEMVNSAEHKETMDGLAGFKFSGAFFASGDTLVGTNLYDSMKNMEAAGETVQKVFSKFKEHLAFDSVQGALCFPTIYTGNVDWYYKGPAKLLGSVASRVTIIPLKPGSKQAVLKLCNDDDVKAGLKDKAFAQLIDICIVFDGDKAIIVSKYANLKALKDSEDKQKEVMASIGALSLGPDRLFGTLAYSYPKVKPAPKKQKKGCC